MASDTICSNGLCVHISMAGDTGRIGFFKNKAGVTTAAIYIHMAAFQGEVGFSMTKPAARGGDLSSGYNGGVFSSLFIRLP